MIHFRRKAGDKIYFIATTIECGENRELHIDPDSSVYTVHRGEYVRECKRYSGDNYLEIIHRNRRIYVYKDDVYSTPEKAEEAVLKYHLNNISASYDAARKRLKIITKY